MQTLDFVSGLHNCLEFILPTPLVFISSYAKTENFFYCLNNFSGIFFLNHLAPPSKGELMPKAPYFFISYWLKVHVISLNLIAFIISIETEASLLALAKSIND